MSRRKGSRANSEFDEKNAVCIGCKSPKSLVPVEPGSFAFTLYGIPFYPKGILGVNKKFCCAACTHHLNLVTQLRSVMNEITHRPMKNCMVCRSGEQLLDLKDLENAALALKNPKIASKHINPIIENTRKLCVTCAYTLQWFYEIETGEVEEPKSSKAQEKPNNASKKLKAVEVTEEISRKKPRKSVPVSRNTRRRSSESSFLSDSSLSASDLQKAKTVSGEKVVRPQRAKKMPDYVEEDLEEIENNVSTMRASKRKLQDDDDKPDNTPSTSTSSRGRVSIKRVSFDVTAPQNKRKPVVTKNANAKPRPASKKLKVIIKKVQKIVSTPRECEICSENFPNGMEYELHKLDKHGNGRQLTINIIRCQTEPEVPVVESTDKENEGGEEEEIKEAEPCENNEEVEPNDTEVEAAPSGSTRKPRKTQPLKKNSNEIGDGFFLSSHIVHSVSVSSDPVNEFSDDEDVVKVDIPAVIEDEQEKALDKVDGEEGDENKIENTNEDSQTNKGNEADDEREEFDDEKSAKTTDENEENTTATTNGNSTEQEKETAIAEKGALITQEIIENITVESITTTTNESSVTNTTVTKSNCLSFDFLVDL